MQVLDLDGLQPNSSVVARTGVRMIPPIYAVYLYRGPSFNDEQSIFDVRSFIETRAFMDVNNCLHMAVLL